MSTEVDARFAIGPDGSMEADLQRLKSLVENSRVPEARAFVQVLEERWPESPRVQHWARVLAPPRSLPGRDGPNRSHRREIAWLKAHAHEYPGQWLAICEDELVAASASLTDVDEQVRARGYSGKVVLLKNPDADV